MATMECEKTITWEPKELVDLGNGLRMGIASDDGYYIVLSQSREGSWKPSNWIPPRVAKRLGELASFQIAIANAFQQ
jgi:RecB family endonuclease NucS